MAIEITDLEKHLIHQAFYKHVNLSPRDLEKLLPEDLIPYCLLEEARPAPLPAPPGDPAADAAPPEPVQLELDLPFMDERDAQVFRLVRIKRKTKEHLTDEDYMHMRRAVNYIRRHSAKPPQKEEKLPAWREGLMRWGFDPEKDDKKETRPGLAFIKDESLPDLPE